MPLTAVFVNYIGYRGEMVAFDINFKQINFALKFRDMAEFIK